MATSSTDEKLCEPCQQKKKKVKVRSFCFECLELLCKDCSDIHLTFKLSRSHNLIDLIPLSKRSHKGDQSLAHSTTADDSAENSSDFVEDELNSDFLEHVTLTNDTILYGAQVAVDHEVANPPESFITAENLQRMKMSKIVDFESSREEDTAKIPITGVISLTNEFIIVATSNKLNAFDQNGGYMSSVTLNEVRLFYAIALVSDKSFVVGGSGSKVQRCSFDGKFHEEELYNVDHSCDGICFNDTFFGILHGENKNITVLDREGKLVRKIQVSEVRGKQVKLGHGISIDKKTNDIYVPCQFEGVLCTSIKGEMLWFKSFPETYTLWGIIEIQNVFCVAHCTKCCLELMSKNGEYVGTLLKDAEMRCPEYIFYCERSNKLYVAFGRNKSGKNDMGQISIFRIKNKS